MKVLVLYDYPPSPGGIATQGTLLHRGLSELGVDVQPVNFESAQEKEWYYRCFEPDVVVGIGYWGLLAACDIYAAPSRLEGFGMVQVEAGACGKPVIGIKAMGMLDTLVHGETAYLASVAQEIRMNEAMVGEESGYQGSQRVVFKRPRTVDYRASVYDISHYLIDLMTNAELRRKMGEAGRKRVVEKYNYRAVAEEFVKLITEKLGIS
jgi:glycosyltransferase involved in cell wall biosynthesis